MYKYLLTPIFAFFLCSVKAQSPIELLFSNSSYLSTDEASPLWFSANQYGRILSGQKFLNLSVLSVKKSYSEEKEPGLNFKWGGDFVAGLSSNSYYQLNQAYTGASLKGWEIAAGMFHDPIRYSGLSTTNGNVVRSVNARPYPMIRIATKDYKPLPLLNSFAFFKCEYDEGMLNDKRYVKNTHLHHKSFFLKISATRSMDLHLGIDHYVMWGGVSGNDKIGKMPKSFKAYLRYITGASGDESFPLTDQLNVAGNHLGAYTLEISKKFKSIESAFYINHLFEDLSGVNLRNWPDNLIGIFIKLKDQKFLTAVNYEFTNTRQQSICDSLYFWDESSEKWKMKEFDNYFLHDVYKSGFTYHRRLLGSPLFFPVVTEEDIVTNIRSNRFYAHHMGISGILGNSLIWESKITYIHHLGKYSKPYDKPNKQLSAIFKVGYSSDRLPVKLSTAIGLDYGNMIRNNTGFQFSVSKEIIK